LVSKGVLELKDSKAIRANKETRVIRERKAVKDAKDLKGIRANRVIRERRDSRA
jgi:hypothetical protein